MRDVEVRGCRVVPDLPGDFSKFPGDLSGLSGDLKKKLRSGPRTVPGDHAKSRETRCRFLKMTDIESQCVTYFNRVSKQIWPLVTNRDRSPDNFWGLSGDRAGTFG